MIYHFIVGDVAGAQLSEAVQAEQVLEGEVVILRDLLHIGPLRKTEEDEKFSQMRERYWKEIAKGEKAVIGVDDMERMLKVSASLLNDENATAWFWMGPTALDRSAYLWMMPYMGRHAGRFYVVNISGLPFLDMEGKLFYPQHLSDLLPKELIKARKLARSVSVAELEVDRDEWEKLMAENAGLRVSEDGKNLKSVDVDYYDEQLLNLCSHHPQKGSRIIRQAVSKLQIPTGDLWIGWRLRCLAEHGKLCLSGNPQRSLHESELSLMPGGQETSSIG